MGTVGKLSGISRDFAFEWSIKDFVSLPSQVEKSCESPVFSYGDTSWFLKIYPNGDVLDSEGYIGLFLWRSSSGSPIHLEYSLSFKASDGTADSEKHITFTFKEKGGFGWPKFLSRSELLQRESQLLPSGTLTVICKMKHLSDISGNNAAERCSHCKMTLDVHEDLSSHQQKCMDKPIKCPECSDVIALKNWYGHECQTRVEASDKWSRGFKEVLLNGEHSDVVFKVKGEEYRLHRVILATRNPYFESMFKNDTKENSSGIVTMEDCAPAVFRSFIHFIYTGKVDELSPENVCDLYVAADKYLEEQLKSECLQFMMNTLSVDSFCDYFAMALKYDLKELFQKSIDLFTTKGKEIARSVHWQNFAKEYPTQANELFIKILDHFIK